MVTASWLLILVKPSKKSKSVSLLSSFEKNYNDMCAILTSWHILNWYLVLLFFIFFFVFLATRWSNGKRINCEAGFLRLESMQERALSLSVSSAVWNWIYHLAAYQYAARL